MSKKTPTSANSIAKEIKRLSVLKGAILDPEMDEKLQHIVSEATRISGFRISLITLVLNRVQYFRAHVGLPDELSVARGTDRCVSFCQFVVRDEKPLIITDAKLDPSLPQELVDRWSIRAYCGFPIVIDGEAVGSLCVIDTEPNKLPESAVKQMEDLATQASGRIKELQHPTSARVLSSLSNQENKNILGNLKDLHQQAMVSAVDLQSVTQIAAMIPPEKLADPRLAKVLSVLKDGLKAHDDLRLCIANMGVLLERLEKNRTAKSVSG